MADALQSAVTPIPLLPLAPFVPETVFAPNGGPHGRPKIAQVALIARYWREVWPKIEVSTEHVWEALDTETSWYATHWFAWAWGYYHQREYDSKLQRWVPRTEQALQPPFTNRVPT